MKRLVAAGGRIHRQERACYDPTHRPWRRDLALDVILTAVTANCGWPGSRGRLMVRDLDRACALSGGSWPEVNALARSIGL
jgi:hypothetical protein